MPRELTIIENGVSTIFVEKVSAPTVPTAPPVIPPAPPAQDFIPLKPVLSGTMEPATVQWVVPAGQNDKVEWNAGEPGSLYNEVPGGFAFAHSYKAGTYEMRCTVTPPSGQAKIYGWQVHVALDTRTPAFSTSGLADNVRYKASGAPIVLGQPIVVRHKNVVLDFTGVELRHSSGAKIIIDIRPEAENTVVIGGSYLAPGKAYGDAPSAFQIRGKNTTILRARAGNRLSRFFDIDAPANGVLIQDCFEDDPSPRSVIDLHFIWNGGKHVCAYGCKGLDTVGEHYVRANDFEYFTLFKCDFATTDEPDFDPPYLESTRHFVRTVLAIQMGKGFAAIDCRLGAQAAIGPGVNRQPKPGQTHADEKLELVRLQNNYIYHGEMILVRGVVNFASVNDEVKGWYQLQSQGWAIVPEGTPGAVVRPKAAVEVGGGGAEGVELRPFANVSIANLKTNCAKVWEKKGALPDNFVVDGVKQ